jgi:hypothetical protein
MATRKPAARATKAAPARPQPKPAPTPAVAPRVPSPDGSLVLVHLGGATLNFRDGSGAKRRVLRGVPFSVDAATASILLRTDPSVSIAEADDAPVPVAATPIEPAPDMSVQVQTPTSESVVVLPSEAAPPAPGPGAITLGDLPPSARIGGL